MSLLSSTELIIFSQMARAYKEFVLTTDDLLPSEKTMVLNSIEALVKKIIDGSDKED